MLSNWIKQFLINKRWKKVMGDRPMDNLYWYVVSKEKVKYWNGERWITKKVIVNEDEHRITFTWE